MNNTLLLRLLQIHFGITILFFFDTSIMAQSNNLIIEPGQTLNIPPRLYKYDTIHIKQNSRLKINDNSSRWLVFHAKVIICEGTIEYRNFKRGVGSVSFTPENGEILEHTFHEALGGSGGNGSGNGYQQGGQGYRTNDFNGGGGGSGAYYQQYPGSNVSGIAATDFRGAPSPNSNTWCYGGNGGRQPYGHGGLIYITADKIVWGTSALVDLRGSDGSNGSKGGPGSCYGRTNIHYFGAGGAGGGSSGGNGGVLRIKCGNMINNPMVDVNPGKGGSGGQKGVNVPCGNLNGQDGLKGDDGEQGYIDLI